MALFLVGEQWRGEGYFRPAVPMSIQDLRNHFELTSVNPEFFWRETRIGYLEETFNRRHSIKEIFKFQFEFLENFLPENVDLQLEPDFTFIGRISVLEEEARKLFLPTIFPLIRDVFLQAFRSQFLVPKNFSIFQKLLDHTRFRLFQQNLKISGFPYETINDGKEIYYLKDTECVRIPDIKWFCNELLNKFSLDRVPKSSEEFYNLAIPAMALGSRRPEKFLWKKRLERKYGRKWRDFWVRRSMDPDRDGLLFRQWKTEMMKLGYIRV